MSCPTKVLGKTVDPLGILPTRAMPGSLQAWLDSPNGKSLEVEQYLVSKSLGHGGMGCVFLANHRVLNKPFAIKFLRHELAQDPEAVNRFCQEIQAIGSLNDPHIVQAVDAGQWNGNPYLVTEFLEGHDLSERIKEHGPASIAESCEFIRQALMGLEKAHRHGFIHRDIKPSNLFIQNDGVVKLIDFGIARSQQANHGATQAGQFIGSVDYLSPEQAGDPRSADARSDIYSLGCTWIFLLSGYPPFPDSAYPSMVAKLKGHMMDQPKMLLQPEFELPMEIHRLISKMVAKQPSDRPANCSVILEELSRWRPPSQTFHKSLHVASDFSGSLSTDRGSEVSKPSRRILVHSAIALLAIAVTSIAAYSTPNAPNPPPVAIGIESQQVADLPKPATAPMASDEPSVRRTLRTEQTVNADAIVVPIVKRADETMNAKSRYFQSK